MDKAEFLSFYGLIFVDKNLRSLPQTQQKFLHFENLYMYDTRVVVRTHYYYKQQIFCVVEMLDNFINCF